MLLGLSRFDLERAARFEVNRAQLRTGDADAIVKAIAITIDKNNEEIRQALLAAGVKILASSNVNDSQS